jgi:hypothetical protein
MVDWGQHTDDKCAHLGHRSQKVLAYDEQSSREEEFDLCTKRLIELLSFRALGCC